MCAEIDGHCSMPSEARSVPRPEELLRQGEDARLQGRPDTARSLYEEAFLRFQAEGDRLGKANVLRALGDLERLLSRYEEARQCYARALPLFREAHDRLGEANVHVGMGELEYALKHDDAARMHFEQALRLFNTMPDQKDIAHVILCLGNLEHAGGNNDAARKRYEESLQSSPTARYPIGEANALYSLGELESMLGRHDVARNYYEDAIEIYRTVQHRLGEAHVLRGLGDLDRVLGQYDAARMNLNEALRLYRLVQDRPGEANALRSLAALDTPLLRKEPDIPKVLYRFFTNEEYANAFVAGKVRIITLKNCRNLEYGRGDAGEGIHTYNSGSISGDGKDPALREVARRSLIHFSEGSRDIALGNNTVIWQHPDAWVLCTTEQFGNVGLERFGRYGVQINSSEEFFKHVSVALHEMHGIRDGTLGRIRYSTREYQSLEPELGPIGFVKPPEPFAPEMEVRMLWSPRDRHERLEPVVIESEAAAKLCVRIA